ncbi:MULTISPECIES: cell surface protein [spotted fever group]|uniref:cell surface protein n=2 Tax=Rickettsia TaxID=780 RepID=UPI0002DFDE16|nr:cell surface protein [Rickettsia philipii]
MTSSVTTSANNQGNNQCTLTIQSGNVNGTIGTNGSSLKLVNIGATPITFSANVFVPVALNKNGSILALADGVTLTGSVGANGAVLSTGGVGGTLNFIGDGNVTQNIGTDAANSPANANINIPNFT